MHLFAVQLLTLSFIGIMVAIAHKPWRYFVARRYGHDQIRKQRVVLLSQVLILAGVCALNLLVIEPIASPDVPYGYSQLSD